MTEQDIFNFVFYPEELSGEKKAEIENSEIYKPAVDFYYHLKKEINKPIDISLRGKIAEKIPSYSLPEIIEFFPVENNIKKNNDNILRYAADSVNEENVKAVSFISPDKNYLIRIIDAKDKKLLYVFSVKEKVIKDFTITIYPKHITYQFTDNTDPLALPLDLDVEKVEIAIN